VRNAESIRGRLSSYQQGVREGRQARVTIDQHATWSPPERQDGKPERQDGKEDTE
jgi:hypothetical protein